MKLDSLLQADIQNSIKMELIMMIQIQDCPFIFMTIRENERVMVLVFQKKIYSQKKAAKDDQKEDGQKEDDQKEDDQSLKDAEDRIDRISLVQRSVA